MPQPEPGFYYHFKHDPEGPINTYAYYVLGVGRHSEDGSLHVVYQPLYTSEHHDQSDYSLRPLSMFMETVTRDGKTFPRFQMITDPTIIEQLRTIRQGRIGNSGIK